MRVKNMTNSRMDLWGQDGKKVSIRVGEIVDLPAKFLETDAVKNLQKQKKIAVIREQSQAGNTEDSKKSKSKKS